MEKNKFNIDYYIENGGYFYYTENDDNKKKEEIENFEEIQFNLIFDSFKYHFANNKEYNKYCTKHNVNPDLVSTKRDLSLIPLLPSSIFKMCDVITGDYNGIVKKCTSSGTKGTISNVYRDRATLDRFFASIKFELTQRLGIKDAIFMHLGPPQEEADDLWIAYAMSALGNIFPITNYMHNGITSYKDFFNDLIINKEKHHTVIIVAPPIMYVKAIDYLHKKGLNLTKCRNLFVMTAGGWKKHSGAEIDTHAFRELIMKNFSEIPYRNIIDCYNMVELNTVLFEDSVNKLKHFPIWVKPMVLDPYSLQPIKHHQVGVLAFLDSSTSSYPGFILTEDLVMFSHETHSNPNNLLGSTMCFCRRVESSESRGCALKVDKLSSFNNQK